MLRLYNRAVDVTAQAFAHLQGAVSEKAIPSARSVQETPGAIVELRRILHLDR